MLRSLDGDKIAYEKMLLTISTMLRGYLMNSLSARHRNLETVEDLIQEVLISIHRKKHLYRTQMPILPWLFAIARYRLIDYLRAENRRPRLEGWEDTFDAPEPKRMELSSERLFELEEILSGLTPRQRRVLLLAKTEGVPLAEIAQQLDMSLSTVKVTIHRCLASIRKQVKK